jgi:hypothetical protein
MEETTTPSPDYIKGFNEGYVLAKDQPELADKLASMKGDSERVAGFHDGRRQYVLEKAKEVRTSRSRDNTVSKQQVKDKSQDRDIDMDR